MLRNRLILLALILGAGTFCSFYGGISYLLLFTALILPLASLAYLVYVLVSFRVVQKVDENILRKGDETTFRFSITNELLITYSDIEPFFQKGLVETENTETKRYTILPGESVKEEERIRFLYRGNYNVGVTSVAVTDFLNLFLLFKTCKAAACLYVLRLISIRSEIGESINSFFAHANNTRTEIFSNIRGRA